MIDGQSDEDVLKVMRGLVQSTPDMNKIGADLLKKGPSACRDLLRKMVCFACLPPYGTCLLRLRHAYLGCQARL